MLLSPNTLMKYHDTELTLQMKWDIYALTISTPASLSVCSLVHYPHKISCFVMVTRASIILDEKQNSPNLSLGEFNNTCR